MPSFDVVSEINSHEVTNAVDQANRELQQRFDFKGKPCHYELNELVVTMTAEVEFQLKQMLEILKMRLVKRGVDASCIDLKDVQKNLAAAKQEVALKHGIDQETGKKIAKFIKESKLKVQGQLQGDKVRVIGKQRDDLQAAIAKLKSAKVELPLQFDNFRD
jgi:cyclic-di-GMP-binding protein